MVPSRDCCMPLPRDAMSLSAVCDCGFSGSYSLTIFQLNLLLMFVGLSAFKSVHAMQIFHSATNIECSRVGPELALTERRKDGAKA